MRTLSSYIIITFLALNLCLLEAHDGSYEMNLDNYIKFNPDMSVLEDIDAVARCEVRDTYAEIFILDKEENYSYIEFNNYYPNNGRWGPWREGYSAEKTFSVTMHGRYLNTMALRTSNYEYIWHGAPALRRYNRGTGEIERGFFEDILRDGYFELCYEINYRHFSECIERIENYADIPISEKIFRVKVLVNNPDEFEKFLKVLLTSNIEVK